MSPTRSSSNKIFNGCNGIQIRKTAMAMKLYPFFGSPVNTLDNIRLAFNLYKSFELNQLIMDKIIMNKNPFSYNPVIY
jgi:hypothetical protein